MSDDHRLLVDLWDEAFYWKDTSPYLGSLCERAFKHIKELEAMIETLEKKPMPEYICPSYGYWNGYPSGDERERLWLDKLAITDKLLLKEAKVSLERLERAETVERERDRLWKALRYYAEFHEDPNDGPWGIHSDDYGAVARAALRGGDYDQ